MLIGGAIVLLAFAAGVAGTWSPCGLSSIETIIAPEAGGDRGGRRASALATFALGAVLGGIVLFAALAVLGAVTFGATSWALVVLLGLAGAADAAGLPVVPRIARQVPESWRRRYPLPIVGLLYGGLLGLGLTTFVMSYGLWAAVIAVLLIGDPAVGLAAGVAFGIGRAIPVVVLAGAWQRDWAERALETMLDRPSTLRLARVVGAVIALAAAAISVPVGSASAASIPRAFSPAVDGGDVVFSRADGSVLVAAGQTPEALPGTGASLGSGRLAWIADGVVSVVDAESRAPVGQLEVPGVDAVAVFGDWLAMRRTLGRRSVIEVRSLADPANVRRVLSGVAGSLSRPSLQADTLVVARAASQASAVFAVTLPDGRPRAVRRPRPGVELRGASLGQGGLLTWVEADFCRQRLLVGPLRGRARSALASWRSTADRDGGFERGFVNAFNRASLCPGGTRGGNGRLRILDAVRGEAATYVSAVPARGGQPRLVVLASS